jgi:hypothetical protein
MSAKQKAALAKGRNSPGAKRLTAKMKTSKKKS